MGLETVGFVTGLGKGLGKEEGHPGQLRPCLLWPQSLCRAGIPSISLNPQTLRLPALCPHCPAQSLFLVLT